MAVGCSSAAPSGTPTITAAPAPIAAPTPLSTPASSAIAA